MKKPLIKTLIISSTLLLSSCASNYTFTPAPQSYRLKGSDKLINITGKVDQSIDLLNNLKSHLTVYFDGKVQIEGYLGQGVAGDINGLQYENKNTSASCSTRHVAKNIGETRCIIFLDNERIATLTM